MPKGEEAYSESTQKRLAELDARISGIQNSTRATIPMVIPLHDILRQKFRWYYKAHLNPIMSKLYGVIFILYIFAMIGLGGTLMFGGKTHTVLAATSACTWTNGGATGVWNSAANWSCGNVPNAGNDVIFDGSKTDNVAIDASATVGSWTVKGTDLPTAGDTAYTGTITVSNSVNITTTDSSGGTGDFRVYAGTMTFGISHPNLITLTTVGNVTFGTGMTLNINETTLVMQGTKNLDANGKTLNSLRISQNISGITSETRSAGTGADDSAVGTLAWTLADPGDLSSSNNVYASSASGIGSTHYIKATNFGYALASDKVITGVKMEFEKKVNVSPFKEFDAAVKIVKGGTVGSTDKGIKAQGVWPTTDTYVAYPTDASTSDSWGETWTYTDINSSTFGVVLSAFTGAGATADFSVDHVRATVYYGTAANSTITATSDVIISGTLTTDANQTLSIASGKLVTKSAGTTTTNNGTIAGSGVLELKDTAGANLSTGGTISSGVRFNTVAANVTMPNNTSGYGGNVEIYNNTASNYTVTPAAGTHTIAGNFTITKGSSGTITFNADTNDPTINIGGNFTNSSGGTFTYGTSTVVLNSATPATVAGSTTFYNLTLDGTAAGAKQITFTAGTRQIVTNTFLLTGAVGNLLTLRSTTPTSPWYFQIPADMTSGTYIDVQDSQNTTSVYRITPGANVTNSGNNDPGWLFATVPAAPTISAPTPLDGGIHWTFADNATDETGFRVYAAGTPDILVKDCPGVDFTYCDETGLAVNFQATGRYVVAYNGAGESAHSATAASIYTLANIPGTPTFGIPPALTSTAIPVITDVNLNPAATEFALSCDGDGTFLNYTTNVCEGIVDDADHWRTFTNWGGASGFIDTGLGVNTQHTYKAKARNGDKVNTVLSTGASKYTLANTPAAPNVNQIYGHDTELQVIVNVAANPAATQFAIQETQQSGGQYLQDPVANQSALGATAKWHTLAEWNSGIGTTVTGLTAGTQYTFQVKAQNGDTIETDFGTTAQQTTPGAGNTVAGSIYSDLGVTKITSAAKTINVSINGNAAATAESVSGDFTVTANEPIDANDVIVVYISGETEKGSMVTKVSSSGNKTGFNIWQNYTILRHEGTITSMTNTILDVGDGLYGTDSDILFHVTAGDSFFDKGLYIMTGKTFAPGGNVTVVGDWNSAASGAIFTHDSYYVDLTGTGTVSAPGSQTSPFDFYDLKMAHNGQTTTMSTGATVGNLFYSYLGGTVGGGTQTITLRKSDGDPMVNNDASDATLNTRITYRPSADITVAGHTVNGTTYIVGQTNDVTINLSSGLTVQGANSIYIYSATAGKKPTLSAGSANITAGNIQIGSGVYDGAIDFGSGNHTIVGDLNRTALASSTANAINFNTATVNIGGLFDFTGITVTASGDSTLNMTATSSKNITFAGQSIKNLTCNGVGGTWAVQDTASITGTLTVTQGTFNANAKAINVVNVSSAGALARGMTLGANTWTVTGNWTQSGSNLSQSVSGSTVQFTGNAVTNQAFTSNKPFNNITLNNTQATYDQLIVTGTLDVNGTLTVTDGKLELDDNNASVTSAGAVSIAAVGAVTKGSGTWTFDGTSTYTDSTVAVQNLGNTTLNGTSITLASAIKVDTLTFTLGTFTGSGNNVTAVNVVATGAGVRSIVPGAGIWTITRDDAGSAWDTSGTNITFTFTNSTVDFTGSSSINPNGAHYFNNVAMAHDSKTTTLSAVIRMNGELATGTGTLTGSILYLYKSTSDPYPTDTGTTITSNQIHYMSTTGMSVRGHNFNIVAYRSTTNDVTYTLSTDLSSSGGIYLMTVASGKIPKLVAGSHSITTTGASIYLGTTGNESGAIDFGSGTHLIGGNLSRNGVTCTANTIDFGSSNISITGNIDFTGITVTAGGTLNATKTSSIQTLLSANQAINNLTHSGAGTLQLVTNDLTINGNFINSGGTFDTNARDITVKGNINLTTGSFTQGTGRINMTGTAAQSFTAGAVTAGHTPYNLTITNAHVDGVTFTDSLTLATGGTLTDTTDNSKLIFADGATYTFPNISLGGAGHVTLTKSAGGVGHTHWNVAGTPVVTNITVDNNDASLGSTIDATAGTNINGGGNTNWNFGPPPTPTGVNLTVDSTSQETVHWDNNSALELNFYVYISTAVSSDCATATYPDTYYTTAVDATSQAASGLDPNAQYCAKVVAHGEFVDSAAGYAADPKYTFANVPGTPTVSAASSSSIKVIVNINSNPASTQFAIQETQTSGGKYLQDPTGTCNDSGQTCYSALDTSATWHTLAEWNGATYGVIVTGLAVNTQYTFQVKARNGNNVETAFAGNPGDSDWHSVTTPASDLTDDSAVGTVAWTNPENAGVQDTSRAVSAVSGAGPVQDNIVKLVVGSNVVGDNLASVSAWSTDDSSYTVYGTSSSMWGLTTATLTAAALNNSNFGMVISATDFTSYSHYLKALNFSMGIPDGAIITGLQVQLTKRKNIMNANINHIQIKAYYTSGAAGGTAYTYADNPVAPSLALSGYSTDKLLATINADTNPAATTYAIYNETLLKYVQADGSHDTAPIWATKTTWNDGGNIETSGLTANTSYTYRIRVRNGDNLEISAPDPQLGNGASLTTNIETPTSVVSLATTPSSINVAANGTYTNLSTLSSGLYFTEDSGNPEGDGEACFNTWLQVNSGCLDEALAAGTQYSYHVKARNAEGAETPIATTNISTSGAAGNDISGSLYDVIGDTKLKIPGEKSIKVIVNHGTPNTFTTTADGDFVVTTSSALNGGDDVLIYIDGNAVNASGVTTVNGAGNITGFNIYQNYVTLRNDTGASLINNTDLSNAKGAIVDNDIEYSVVDNNISFTNNFYVESAKTYTPAGTVSAHDANIAGTMNGGAANTINVSGSWNCIGTFNGDTSNVNFTSVDTETITSGAGSFTNITFNGNGSWTAQNGLTASEAMTLTRGTFDANDKAISIQDFVGTGAIGRTLTMGNGTWTISDDWDSTGSNQTINPEGSTADFTGSGEIRANAPETAPYDFNKIRLAHAGQTITLHTSVSVADEATVYHDGILDKGAETADETGLILRKSNGDPLLEAEDGVDPIISASIIYEPSTSISIGGHNFTGLVYYRPVDATDITFNLTSAITGTGTLIVYNRSTTNNSTLNIGANDVAAAHIKIGSSTYPNAYGMVNLGTQAISLSGDLGRIGSNASSNNGLDMGTATSIRVGGSIDFRGTAVTARSTTVTMTAIVPGKTIWNGGQSFNDLVFDGVGGSWTMQDDSTIAGNYTVTNGSVAFGSTATAFTATVTGKNITSGGSSFGGMIFNGVGGGWTPLDDLTLTGDFTITNGTFSSSDKTVTFNKPTGIQYITSNGQSFNNLNHTGNGTVSLADDLYVKGNLNLGGKPLTHNSRTILLNGTAAQSLTAGSTAVGYRPYNLSIQNHSVAGVTFTDSVTLATGGTFTSSVSDTSKIKLTFTAGATYTFPNINIGSADADVNDITMTSSGEWFFDVTTGSRTVTNVAVDHSTAGVGLDITATTNCTDNNNNTRWNFGAPVAPTNIVLNATSTDTDKMTVTWDNVTQYQNGYIVSFADATADANCATLTYVTGYEVVRDVITYEGNGLNANTRYCAKVITNGNYDDSSPAYSAVPKYTRIETPTGINFNTINETSVIISASGTLTNLETVGSSGVTFTETTTHTNGGGEGCFTGWTDKINTCTDSNLTPNTTYAYKVKARNGNGIETTETSASAERFTKANIPGVPPVTANYSDANSYYADVAVSANSNPNATNYKTFWDTNPIGAFSDVLEDWTIHNNNDTISHTNLPAGLSCNQAYYYKEEAKNGEGVITSLTSAGFDTTPPCAPADPNETELTANSTKLNWTIVEGPASTYTLKYGTDPDPNSTEITDISDINRIVSDLSSSTTYYFKVKANNTYGIGAWSAVDSFTTPAAVDHLNISLSGSSFAAGETFNVTTTAVNALDEKVNDYTCDGSISTSTDAKVGDSSFSLVNGENTTSLNLQTTGTNHQLNVTCGPLSGVSSVFTITPGPTDPASVVSTSSTSLYVNQIATIGVVLSDIYGNLATDRGVGISSNQVGDISTSSTGRTSDSTGIISFSVSSGLAHVSTFTISDENGVTLLTKPRVMFGPALNLLDNQTDYTGVLDSTNGSIKLGWVNPTLTGFSGTNIYRREISSSSVRILSMFYKLYRYGDHFTGIFMFSWWNTDLSGDKIVARNYTGTNYTDTDSLSDGQTYYYYYKAVYNNDQNQLSSETYPVKVIYSFTPDTESPTKPRNLRATDISCSKIDLVWDASTDNVGVAYYEIYNVNGTKVKTTTSPAAAIENLSPESSYQFYIIAYDSSGNFSDHSEVQTFTTKNKQDCTDPITDPICRNGGGTVAFLIIGNAPSEVVAGENFNDNVSVKVMAADGGGEICTDYENNVYFDSSDKRAILSVTRLSPYLFNKSDAGIHEFQGKDFKLFTTGEQTLTVTDGTASGKATIRVLGSSQVLQKAGTVVSDLFDKNASKVNTAVVAATAALLLTPAVVNLAIGLGNILPQLFYWLTQLMQILGIRKKRKPWGVIFNSQTGQPLNLAMVKIYDKENDRLLESTVTDKEGRFGFLVRTGNYYIVVTKTGFTFPSQFKVSGFYENVYTSGNIGIDVNDEGSIDLNVPIDPQAKASAVFTFWAILIKINRLLQKVRIPLMTIGIVFTIVMMAINYNVIYAFSLVLYAILFVLEYFQSKKSRPYGMVSDVFGHPLEIAIVRIFNKKTNRLMATDVTDSQGRFKFLVNPGIYYTTAAKPGYIDFKSHIMYLECERTMVTTNIKLKKIDKVE